MSWHSLNLLTTLSLICAFNFSVYILYLPSIYTYMLFSSFANATHIHVTLCHIHIFNFIIEQIFAEHSQLKINCANSGSESFCKSYISLNVRLYLSMCA